jgi:hypothetical protein
MKLYASKTEIIRIKNEIIRIKNEIIRVQKPKLYASKTKFYASKTLDLVSRSGGQGHKGALFFSIRRRAEKNLSGQAVALPRRALPRDALYYSSLAGLLLATRMLLPNGALIKAIGILGCDLHGVACRRYAKYIRRV